MATALQVCETTIMNVQPEFQRVLVDQAIKFERECGFALQVLQSNDYTAKVAANNPNSLKASIVNVAAIGISLNPASKLAYLVPRKSAVCLDISYMGLMHLAQLCGAIQWGQARIVHANDKFQLNAINEAPSHEFSPFAKAEQRGEIVGAYVVVKTDTGDYLTHTMTIEEINSIKNRSEPVKAGKSSPWLTDFNEMAKKTVVKQAHKYWPRRERLDNAIHYMDTDGGEGIVQGERDITPCSERQLSDISALLALTGKDWDGLTPKFKKGAYVGKSISDLTGEDAGKVIDFLQAVKEKQDAANNSTAQAAA